MPVKCLVLNYLLQIVVLLTGKLGKQELLIRSTVRLDCLNAFGERSVGTGFMYKFFFTGESSYPAIISNRHVIEGAVAGELVISLGDPDGNPLEEKKKVNIDRFSERWIHHPDNDIDLSIMPLGRLYNDWKKDGINVSQSFITDKIIPDSNQCDMLQPMEEIIMIGYPVGLWDKENNLPISRKGITATHPKINYCKRREFLIDMPVYPGSSGSPIYAYNPVSENAKTASDGSLEVRKPLLLLGIVYGYYPYEVTDDPTILKIPTDYQPIPVTKVPVNIGAVIKSSCIKDFEPLLQETIERLNL